MTISSQVRTAGPFTGNGVATGGPFAFKVFAGTDLIGVETDTNGDDRNLVYGTDFSVTLNPDQNASPGGTINYLIAGVPSLIPTGYVLNFTSAVANLQPVALTNKGGFFPRVINDALDRLTILVQQTVRAVNASLKFPLSDGAGLNSEIPNKTVRANQFLGFDLLGNVIVGQPSSVIVSAAMQPVVQAATTSSALTVLGFSNFIKTLIDDADAATARGTLGLGAFATQGIGAGLEVSGGNVRAFESFVNPGNIANYAFSETDRYKTIQRSYSSGATADTLPGGSNGLANGFKVRIWNTSAGPVVITGSGSTQFYTGNIITSTSVIVPVGALVELLSLGVSGGTLAQYMVTVITPNYAPAAPASGTARGIKAYYLSNTSVRVELLNEIVLRNVAGDAVTLGRHGVPLSNIDVSISSTGANGLDTGSAANNTWYYVFIIYNPATGTVAGLASTSRSAPTLPSGYTHYAFISAFRTNGSAQVIGFIQYGKDWFYRVGSNLTALPVVASGSSGNVSTPTYTATDVQAIVPAPTLAAGEIFLMMARSSSGNVAQICSPNNTFGGLGSASNPPFMQQQTGGYDSTSSRMWLESNNVHWASDNAANALYCTGFALFL